MNLFLCIGFVGDPVRFQLSRLLCFCENHHHCPPHPVPFNFFSARLGIYRLTFAHFVSHLWLFGVSHKCFIGIVCTFVYMRNTLDIAEVEERRRKKTTNALLSLFDTISSLPLTTPLYHIHFHRSSFFSPAQQPLNEANKNPSKEENLTNKSFTEKSWAIKKHGG